jgi:hypothetical protein
MHRVSDTGRKWKGIGTITVAIITIIMIVGVVTFLTIGSSTISRFLPNTRTTSTIFATPNSMKTTQSLVETVPAGSGTLMVSCTGCYGIDYAFMADYSVSLTWKIPSTTGGNNNESSLNTVGNGTHVYHIIWPATNSNLLVNWTITKGTVTGLMKTTFILNTGLITFCSIDNVTMASYMANKTYSTQSC